MLVELKGLTSLRGLAALAVVLQHFSSTAQEHTGVWIPSLFPHGYVAVDFFFVLSGYIMCYVYLSAFERKGWAAYGPFLKKRAVRLMPLNAVITVLLLGLASISTATVGRNLFFGAYDGWFDVLANLLMVQGIGIGNNLNGPSWSVSAELIAYAFFPLLIYVVFGRRLWLPVLAGAVALALLTYVALQNPNLGLGSGTPLLGSFRCAAGFTFGMLAYRVQQRTRFGEFLARESTARVALALTLVLLVVRVDLLTALSFPLLVAACAAGEGRGRIGRALQHPALVWLGYVSFSLYLSHDMLRWILLEGLRRLHPEKLGFAGGIAFALVGVALSLVWGWIFYRFVERPSRDWLTVRMMKPGSGRAATAGPAAKAD